MSYRAYLDDSGESSDPNETITCVAGCVSTDDAWSEFDAEWKETLARFEMPYLHMKEYSASVGPFAKWKGNEGQRKSFLSSLMDVIDRHVMAVVGATVPVAAFEKLQPEQQAMVGDPHLMSMQEALHASCVLGWGNQGLVDVIFSDQTELRGRTERVFSYVKKMAQIGPHLRKFSWGSYREIPGLQVADLVAYELLRFARDLLVEGETRVRTPMKRLFRENYFFTFFDHNAIVKRFYFGKTPLP